MPEQEWARGSSISRRKLLETTALGGAGVVAAQVFTRVAMAENVHAPFEWEETSITTIVEAITSGKVTAAGVAAAYLDRIRALDQSGPTLRAVIELNPDASGIAEALDVELKAHGKRGALHGVPILVKDNIDTHDKMMTTAGSLALVGSIPPLDAEIVRRLRAAGAVILGKTNLSEWANFRSTSSTSGWSGRGGLTKNPYALDRNPSGSSSGSAVAVSASLCAAAIGSETDGSIVSPAGVCGIVGLKPTVGLVSRAGIIPISCSQDTAGPMGRCVKDVAILLGVLAGPDSRDPATHECADKVHPDYTTFLDADGLRGARIGFAEVFLTRHDKSAPAIEAALAVMQDRGATIVRDVETPSLEGIGRLEFEVMLYEFKAGLNAYLAGLGEKAPIHSLSELIAFNSKHAEMELAHFGQEILIAADAIGPLSDKAYADAVVACRARSREQGIDAAMNKHRLDAIVAPTGGPACKTDLVLGNRSLGGSSTPAAVAGYPNITVPAGEVHGLPVGISFFGRAYSEPVLLRLAYAFEQATHARRAPKYLESVG